MKKINYVKFVLDLAMGLVFALLFNKQVLGGLAFHEIAGTALGAAVLIHILLNWRWVKNVTLKLFDRKLPGNTRFGYVLNLLLLISMAGIIVTGILISKIVFPAFNVGNERWLEGVHISLSFVVLIILGIHVGLHWKWVISVWNKIVPLFKGKTWVGYAMKVAAVAILAFGVYEINATGYMQRAASITSALSGSSAMGAEGGHGGLEGRAPEGGFTKGDPGVQANVGGDAGQSVQPNASSEGTQSEAPSGEQMRNFKNFREGGGSANPFQVIGTYFGIMAVFVVITYYLEKLWFRKKRKAKAEAAPAQA